MPSRNVREWYYTTPGKSTRILDEGRQLQKVVHISCHRPEDTAVAAIQHWQRSNVRGCLAKGRSVLPLAPPTPSVPRKTQQVGLKDSNFHAIVRLSMALSSGP